MRNLRYSIFKCSRLAGYSIAANSAHIVFTLMALFILFHFNISQQLNGTFINSKHDTDARTLFLTLVNA